MTVVALPGRFVVMFEHTVHTYDEYLALDDHSNTKHELLNGRITARSTSPRSRPCTA